MAGRRLAGRFSASLTFPLLLAASAGSASAASQQPAGSASARAASSRRAPWLVDGTAASGMAFTHHAARSDRYLYPETFGAGVALFDLDGDGDLDVLLLDTGSPPGAATQVEARSALYRNELARAGAWPRLVRLEAPDLKGLAAMGACTGDVDGDGDGDVYLTGLPAGRLLVNDRGRLRPVPDNAGIDDPGWGTSCVFFDRDADGALDLWVAHYVKWTAASEKACGGELAGFRSYCPPDEYAGEADRLFAGDGRGHFRDVSSEAGIAGEGGKGLGVVAADIDGDSRTDVYVANDQTPNALWLNAGGGRFRDVALLSGTALSEEGRARAGMGVDAGDVDGDGDVDLTVTNLDLESNALFLDVGSSGGIPRFRDGAPAAGLATATLMSLGFGTAMADLDSDGDLDLFAANGHVLPNVNLVRPSQTAAMEDQLLENLGTDRGAAFAVPRFRDARTDWLPAAADRRVSRGLAVGDLDDDGDLDLVVTTNDGPARVLRNDRRPRRWVGLTLAAAASAPGAPGAVVTFREGALSWTALRRTGASYLSASDPRVVLGLPAATAAATGLTADVAWPSGRRERFGPLAAGRYQVVKEGTGVALPATPR